MDCVHHSLRFYVAMIWQERPYVSQLHILVVCTIVQRQNKLPKAFKRRMIHNIPNRIPDIHMTFVFGDDEGSRPIENGIISGGTPKGLAEKDHYEQ